MLELAPDEVVVGRVGRPHGVRGEVGVEPRTDEPDSRYVVGAVLAARTPDGHPHPAYPLLTVAGTRWHRQAAGDRLLVRFRELADREAAEAARGLLLVARIDLEERPEDPDEYYDHQLVGLTVVTAAGDPAGEVAEVLHAGAQDLLVVRRPGAEDALVPFVAALVPDVDLSEGRVTVADLPGLLDDGADSAPGD